MPRRTGACCRDLTRKLTVGCGLRFSLPLDGKPGGCEVTEIGHNVCLAWQQGPARASARNPRVCLRARARAYAFYFVCDQWDGRTTPTSPSYMVPTLCLPTKSIPISHKTYHPKPRFCLSVPPHFSVDSRVIVFPLKNNTRTKLAFSSGAFVGQRDLSGHSGRAAPEGKQGYRSAFFNIFSRRLWLASGTLLLTAPDPQRLVVSVSLVTKSFQFSGGLVRPTAPRSPGWPRRRER